MAAAAIARAETLTPLLLLLLPAPGLLAPAASDAVGGGALSAAVDAGAAAAPPAAAASALLRLALGGSMPRLFIHSCVGIGQEMGVGGTGQGP